MKYRAVTTKVTSPTALEGEKMGGGDNGNEKRVGNLARKLLGFVASLSFP